MHTIFPDLAVQPPGPAALLEAWELGTAHTSAGRALALLAAAHPAVPRAELAAWPVGRRDRQLLALRVALFGAQLVAVANCARCGERLELLFAATQIIAAEATETDDLMLEWQHEALRFRLPNVGDLLALERCGDREQARRVLLQRCSLNADTATLDALPEAALQALAAQMSQADPQADVRLELTCPACDYSWVALFDITSYLWAELDSWAQRTLREVHSIAGAYGWSEAAILALSPQRRQRYLDLIAGREYAP